MLHHRLRASLMGNRQATYIGGSSAIGTATLTLPAHQAGDLLMVMGADGGDGFNSHLVCFAKPHNGAFTIPLHNIR